MLKFQESKVVAECLVRFNLQIGFLQVVVTHLFLSSDNTYTVSVLDVLFSLVYIALVVWCSLQLHRILRFYKYGKGKTPGLRALLGQHVGMLLVCVIRALVLLLRGEIGVVTVVLLASVPYAMLNLIWAYLICTWASVDFYSFDKNPFKRLKNLFLGVSCIIVMITIGIPIAMSVTSNVCHQIDLAKLGLTFMHLQA